MAVAKGGLNVQTTNSSVWMMGGLEPQLVSVERDRANLRAFLESRRTEQRSLVERLRRLAPARASEPDLVCCPV